MRQTSLFLGALVLTSASLFAVEMVGVPGSNMQYPAAMETNVAGKAVKFSITGTAMRTKIILNVYSIGSYVQTGAAVKSADSVVSCNQYKRLHLVMERTVDGKALGEAFRSAVRMNYPEPAFKDEVSSLVSFMSSTAVHKGEHILLTHIPGVGLHCSVAGKADFTIKNPKFSQAVWEIYFGKNNLGEHIKRGLVSRL